MKVIILLTCFLLIMLINLCAPKKQTTKSKLMMVYKDQLMAYQINLSYKMAKLKNKVKLDTIIKPIDWKLDKHAFFQIMEETNYYNLDLISVYSHKPEERPASPTDPDKIVLSDVNYKYKTTVRKLCDTYIIKQSELFNAKYKDNKIPKTLAQLTEYLTFKMETINYLLLNSCY